MTLNAKRILIVGNLGYIGPVLVSHLREVAPDAHLAGYDTGFFQGCLIDPRRSSDHLLDEQIFGDVRGFEAERLSGYDAVVALAAISNDPMGNVYEQPTLDINAAATAALARVAKERGVGHFVFASSCSVYGAGGDRPKDEDAELNPLTAYARSKIGCEEKLRTLAGEDFVVTCLRFATACGASPRLRLDLVLNDFVASASIAGKIEILSDGTPWRPLIDVGDMSRAIEWACGRAPSNGGAFLTVNAGADDWNYTIKDLALAVQAARPGTDLSINRDAAPDKRSYRVDFSKFRELAPDHQPLQTLETTIAGLADMIGRSAFADPEFRQSYLVRLSVLNELRQSGRLTADLFWA